MPEDDHALQAWNAETYIKRNERRDYLGRRNFRAVMRFSKRFLRGRVLDAGCGDGATVRALRAWNPRLEVMGVDLLPSSGEGLIQCDLTALPFEDNHFNCVLCMDVLEHLDAQSLEKVLQEIRRVLKSPNGCLCVTTPNDEDLNQAQRLCPHCNKWFHPAGHVRSFTPEKLEEALRLAGFQDVSVRSYGLDAYYHFGAAAGLVSALGRIVLPKMRWDEWLFCSAHAGD